MAVGLVFFIRRPAVSMTGPLPYIITVTEKTLLAVVDAVEARRKRGNSADEAFADGYGFLGCDESAKIVTVIMNSFHPFFFRLDAD